MSTTDTGAPRAGKRFTVQANGREWEFAIGKAAFDRFLREAQADANRAANNLLLATCTEREALLATFDEHWDLPLQMMGVLSPELIPDREVAVKKR